MELLELLGGLTPSRSPKPAHVVLLKPRNQLLCIELLPCSRQCGYQIGSNHPALTKLICHDISGHAMRVNSQRSRFEGFHFLPQE